MSLLKGKKGIIMGVANDRSIAASVAKILHHEGAQIGYSYLPDQGDRPRNLKRLEQVTQDLDPAFLIPCDVNKDEDVATFFATAGQKMDTIDFVIHSIAFAPTQDIKCPSIEASREGFHLAMDASVYSFLAVAREAKKLMPNGGSICTMTYFGGEKVMPGYNLMGICKAALEASVRYAAYDLGPQNIRVNAISAGPIKTLAASAVGDFKKMLGNYEEVSPMKRNIDGKDVAMTTCFLVSDLSKMISGETIHVDAGFHIMGGMISQETDK